VGTALLSTSSECRATGISAFTEKGLLPMYLHSTKGKDVLAEFSQIIPNYEFHIGSSGGWRALQTPPVQRCAVVIIIFFFRFKGICQIPETNHVMTPIGLCLYETVSSLGAQRIFLSSACTASCTTCLSMTCPIRQNNERKAILQ